jgi:hypothetical protein
VKGWADYVYYVAPDEERGEQSSRPPSFVLAKGGMDGFTRIEPSRFLKIFRTGSYKFGPRISHFLFKEVRVYALLIFAEP